MFAQGGISASPLKLEFDAVSGSSQDKTIVLSNTGNGQLELTASVNDWYRDSTGNIVTVSAGSLASSCSRWIKIYPSTHITLAPGETVNVTISVTPGKENNLIHRNSMVFFTQLNPQQRKTSDGININMAVRIGVQVYYTPNGLTGKNIEIINFKTLRSIDSAYGGLLELHLKNTGMLVADGRVDFELVNLSTGKKTTLPHSAFYTLPGALRVITIPLKRSIPPGKYSATALIDFGRKEELKIGELEFTYPPGNNL